MLDGHLRLDVWYHRGAAQLTGTFMLSHTGDRSDLVTGCAPPLRPSFTLHCCAAATGHQV
jgi:hypothetical protein